MFPKPNKLRDKIGFWLLSKYYKDWAKERLMVEGFNNGYRAAANFESNTQAALYEHRQAQLKKFINERY